MSGTKLRERLRDPAYFGLHLQAATAIREVGGLGWYDSHFLRRVEVARRYLARVRSQWHYRRPKVAGGFCHLLFFHYYPEGCADLVEPSRWAAHFAVPELGPLCDLFGHPNHDGLPE